MSEIESVSKWATTMALEPNNPQATLNFRPSSISTRKSQQINYGPICLTEVGFSPIQDSFDGTPHFEFPGIQHTVTSWQKLRGRGEGSTKYTSYYLDSNNVWSLQNCVFFFFFLRANIKKIIKKESCTTNISNQSRWQTIFKTKIYKQATKVT